MVPTFAEFAADLTGMQVTGVQRVFTTPPEVLNSAQLPALFPMLPAGDQAPLTFGQSEYGGSRTLDLWVPIRASGAGTLASYYPAMTAMMDSLDAALRALDATVAYRLTWRLQAALLEVAGHEYRGIVVTTTAEEG